MRPIVLLFISGLSFMPTIVLTDDGNPDLQLLKQTSLSPVKPLDLLGSLPVRMLNTADDGRLVAVAEIPPGWQLQLASERSHSMELLVLEGVLDWAQQPLGRYDFAYLPQQAEAPLIGAGAEGARVLIFLDPPRENESRTGSVVTSGDIPWRPGVVAKDDTGLALQLEVKDLLWVEETGQRTWLLRAGPDLTVPWEIHNDAEEGYLLEGDFRLGECLSTGPTVFSYTPGGYFYRPGGLVHSGPQSGTDTYALWLLRTPTRLTVEFLEGCPDPQKRTPRLRP